MPAVFLKHRAQPRNLQRNHHPPKPYLLIEFRAFSFPRNHTTRIISFDRLILLRIHRNARTLKANKEFIKEFDMCGRLDGHAHTDETPRNTIQYETHLFMNCFARNAFRNKGQKCLMSNRLRLCVRACVIEKIIIKPNNKQKAIFLQLLVRITFTIQLKLWIFLFYIRILGTFEMSISVLQLKWAQRTGYLKNRGKGIM